MIYLKHNSTLVLVLWGADHAPEMNPRVEKLGTYSLEIACFAGSEECKMIFREWFKFILSKLKQFSLGKKIFFLLTNYFFKWQALHSK